MKNGSKSPIKKIKNKSSHAYKSNGTIQGGEAVNQGAKAKNDQGNGHPIQV